MKKRICIDPGHPSYFEGTRKINYGAVAGNIKEVELNLNLADILRILLEKRGYKIRLTRVSNKKVVANKKRAEIARDFNSELFLRIHVDYERHNDFSIKGTKTIYPPPTAENIHLRSWGIALSTHKAVVVKTGLVNRGVCDERVCLLTSKFGMLTGTYWANKFNIPTVLLEVVYLSNSKDREWIIKASNQELYMTAVADGIDHFYSS
jgi:N-acetylmuramoyl-L-alanine amidase